MCFQIVGYLQEMILINSPTASQTQFSLRAQAKGAYLVFKSVSLYHYVETLCRKNSYLVKASTFQQPECTTSLLLQNTIQVRVFFLKHSKLWLYELSWVSMPITPAQLQRLKRVQKYFCLLISKSQGWFSLLDPASDWQSVLSWQKSCPGSTLMSPNIKAISFTSINILWTSECITITNVRVWSTNQSV